MEMTKKAIITGVTGQDGYYLAKILLELGYEVIGTTRNCKLDQPLFSNLPIQMITSDYSKKNLEEIILKCKPTEIYHLAGQTFVGKSWTLISETVEASALIAINLLDLINTHDRSIKFFNASSSEIYSDSSHSLMENSLKEPTTPYGCSKLFSHSMTKAFRKNYDLFTVNGILFNHESFRRGDDFLTKKLVKGVVDIYEKKRISLPLGNLDIIRDWGSAEEYMMGVFLMMNLETPDDFNICSSTGRSIRDIVKYTFSLLDLDYQRYINIDTNLVRNSEKTKVIGANQKIFEATGWKPSRTIESVMKQMMSEEFKSRGMNELF